MSTDITDRIRAFLDATFPGSDIDDGYYFVSIKPRALRRVKRASLQQVVDRLCENDCWLVFVGPDPRKHVHARAAEQRTVVYAPDWNIQERRGEWLLDLEPGRVDMEALGRMMDWPGALIVIDPQRRVVFDHRLQRLYADSEDHLISFIRGIEDCFETPAPTYDNT
jgi:hypothetical protein